MNDINLRDLFGRVLLKQTLLSSPYCYIPLFHGTDRAVLHMSQEERRSLREACGILIDYLLPVFDLNGFENRKSAQNELELREIRTKVLIAHSKAVLRRSNNVKYSYDNIYLTFSPIKADVYATNAWVCGELGYIAYWLLRGAKRLNYQLPAPSNTEREAIVAVENAALRKPDPVLLVYSCIEKSRLLTEAGMPIDWEMQVNHFLQNLHLGEVRVIGEFDISNGVCTTLAELTEAALEK